MKASRAGRPILNATGNVFMFRLRVVLALMFCLLPAPRAIGISPGFYDCGVNRKLLQQGKYLPAPHRDACEQIDHLVKHAEQKIFIGEGQTAASVVGDDWTDFDKAKAASRKGQSMLIWFQTRRLSTEPYLPDQIKDLKQQIRKMQRQIDKLGYSRVLIITPSLSNSKLGCYVLKDTQKASAL